MKALVILAVFTNSLSAQTFLDGTPEWTYCYSCISFGYYYMGNTTIKYDSDINHQDTTLKLFIVNSQWENQSPISNTEDYYRLDSMYLYEEESKVYKWHLLSNEKELLYDFNAEINDTVLINISDGNEFYFVLDSIGTTSINGIELNTQRLEVIHECPANSSTISIIDKIGAVEMDYFEIANSFSCWIDACARAHVFSNYTNQALGIYYDIGETCLEITSTDDILSTRINIFPNPAINYIYIDNYELTDRIDIYNTNGNKVVSKQIFSEKIEFDLDTGIYLISVTNKNSKISTFKLYVEKSG